MDFSNYLSDFEPIEPLRQRVLYVLERLPTEVIRDFTNDPRFTVALDNFVPGQGSQVFMACPGGTDDSRSIVLKPRLADCSEAFAHYVIAHEFAHAYLRNGGWGEITDHEDAANALAANWGFSRPDERPWLGSWK